MNPLRRLPRFLGAYRLCGALRQACRGRGMKSEERSARRNQWEMRRRQERGGGGGGGWWCAGRGCGPKREAMAVAELP
uniref:Uncharacterized protein n=1 Tax=Arundo donax TaxID=35708 RepID=A0A0A8XWF4_ARUDO